MCSGRWPGVWIASIVRPRPSSSIQPSAKGSCGYSASASSWMWIVAPGRPRQAAVAGDVVGVVVGLEHVLDPDPVQAGQAQVGLDVPLRVDDRGDARVAVADQVGGAAEVLVDDLAEEHQVELQASGSAVSLATSAGR